MSMSYAQFVSSGKRTPAEIIAFKRLNQTVKATEAFSETPPFQVVVKNFVIPAQVPGTSLNTTPSDAEVKQLLSGIRGFTFAESVKIKDDKGKVGLAKNLSQLYTTGNVDNLPGTAITTCMARKGLEGSQEDFDLLTKDIGLWYYGGGTFRGLLERLRTGHGLASEIRPDPSVSADEFKFICSVLPCDRSKLPNLKGRPPTEVQIAINYLAHAGAPWFDPKVRVYDVIEEIADQAQQLYNLAAESYEGLKRYLEKDHPERGLVILKNKRELSKRDKAFTKVRPYYVLPGGLRYLFTCLLEPFSDAQQNYWQKGVTASVSSEYDKLPSISAFRFSWLHGGAKRILQFVEDCKDSGPGLYILTFGDDQFWVIVCKNGEVCISTPDIIAMDMSLGKNTCLCFTKKLLYDMQDHIDEVWKRIGILQGQYVFRHPTLVHHAIVMQKDGGVSSGVNGTTHVDMVGSARIAYRAKGVLSECKDSNDATVKLKKTFEIVERELGMRVKPGTETLIVHRPGSNTISLPFLGMTIDEVDIDGVKAVVPVPDVPKLMASLFYSSTSKSDSTRLSALLSKCVGLCASGGYTNKLMYYVCKRVYDFHKNSCVPVQYFETMGGEDIEEVKAFLNHEGLTSAKDFPTRRWFLSLYLDIDHPDAESSAVNFEAGDVSGLTEEEEELLNFKLKKMSEEDDDWAKQDYRAGKEAQGPRIHEDIGSSSSSAAVVARPTTKEKAGLIPPDYARRAAKIKILQQRSAKRHEEKLARWKAQKAKMSKKYKGKAAEELQFEEEYEQDDADLEATERAKEEAEIAYAAAREAWEAMEYELKRKNQLDKFDDIYDSYLEEHDVDDESFDDASWDKYYGEAYGGFSGGMGMEDPDTTRD
nr:MAG: RNA-dependent RNA polymerase [Permutotetraviridae sp.]